MSFNLLAEAEKDGFRQSRSSTSRNGQRNGPCIMPGCKGLGKDRLRIQPNQGTYGWFACSICGAKGSGIDYLMLMRGYSKNQALIEVDWKPKDGSMPNLTIPDYLFSAEQGSTHDAPPEQWQDAADSFYRRCEKVLWSEQGKETLAYLRKRGLKDETIKAAGLGYHPVKEWEHGYKWGRKKDVMLWRGIVIPWFIDKQIWRITIRGESVPGGGEGRYKQVAGGSNGLYCADTLKRDLPVVLVEGEFDALSVAQTCGDLVNVCATGTTGGSHTTKWLAALAQRSYVLIAFDAEKDKGDVAVIWWSERLENAQRFRPLWDDANQMLQDGVDLREAWILPKLQELQAATHPHTAEETPAPPPEQPQEPASQDATCCKCGTPAKHASPSGYTYCTEHYQCIRGHMIRWRKGEDGRWLCACYWEESWNDKNSGGSGGSGPENKVNSKLKKAPDATLNSGPLPPLPPLPEHETDITDIPSFDEVDISDNDDGHTTEPLVKPILHNSPVLPTVNCAFCNIAKWIWSPQEQDHICLKCYSPLASTLKNNQIQARWEVTA